MPFSRADLEEVDREIEAAEARVAAMSAAGRETAPGRESGRTGEQILGGMRLSLDMLREHRNAIAAYLRVARTGH